MCLSEWSQRPKKAKNASKLIRITDPENISSDDFIDDVEDDLDERHDDQLQRRRLADDDAERDENGRGGKVAH